MKYLSKIVAFKKEYSSVSVELKDIVIKSRITLLLGQNGSGKSTLLKAMGGLIKFEGQIELIGKATYMSEFTSFPSDISLNDFIYELKKVSKNSIKSEGIEYLLDMFHLKDKKNELISNFSKGMKAKVNLVQVFLEESDIYLLDEPINGLDKEGVESLVTYINDSDKSFLISTHAADDFKLLDYEVIHLCSS